MCCTILGKKRATASTISTKSDCRYSLIKMQGILEKLKNNINRDTTNKNYYTIWKSLNNFLVKLDSIPEFWEERVAIFCAYLVEYKNIKSTTQQSYISAIKHTLKCDRYKWNEEMVWLNSLIRSCKKVNDTVYTRFPIHFKLLEMILFEVNRIYDTQPFLTIMYQSIFTLAYYGLLRTGETVLADGGHMIKAKNVFIADNKDKIRIILHSSKTHDESTQPQEIKFHQRNKLEKEINSFVHSSCSEHT